MEDNNEIDSIEFQKELEKTINNSLDYLLAECFIKKENNLYSLKTKKEIEKEINYL